MNSPLGKAHFGWRDIIMFACVALTAFFGFKGQQRQDAQTSDNRRGAILVAVAVCQQANILVQATLAKKTPEERRLLRPLVTQYLDPLNRALVELGHEPNCDAD